MPSTTTGRQAGHACGSRLLLSVLAVALVPGAASAASRKPAEPPRLDAASWLLIDLEDEAELAAHAPARERAIASTTKLMTAYLALRRAEDGRPPHGPRLPGSAGGVGRRADRGRAADGPRPARGDDAAERQRRGRHRRRRRLGLGVRVRRRDEPDRGGARPDRHPLREPDRARREGQLLDRRGSLRTCPEAARRQALPPDRGDAEGDADQRRPATGSSPTPTRCCCSDPTVDGVKTGHTTDAGYVLVASAKRDGVPLLAAVLGAPSEADRDAETEQLLDYGYSLYDREVAVDRGEEEASAGVRYEDEPLSLVAKQGVTVEVRDDQRVEDRCRGAGRGRGTDRRRRAARPGDGHRRRPLRRPRAAGRRPARSRRRPIVDKIGGPLVVGLIVFVVIVILSGAAIALRRHGKGDDGDDRSAEERMRRREERIDGMGEGA